MNSCVPSILTMRAHSRPIVTIAGAFVAPVVHAVSPPGSAASASIPFKRETASESSPLGDAWLGLVLVLAVMSGVALWYRRRLKLGPRRRDGGTTVLTIVESAWLGERMRVSIVRYRQRELLIAHGDQGATLLSDAPIEPDSRPVS